MVITYSKSMDQPGKVANPARGQLYRENECLPVRSRLRIWSRETGSTVPSRLRLIRLGSSAAALPLSRLTPAANNARATRKRER